MLEKENCNNSSTKRGKLYVFFGASGIGKDFLAKKLVEYGKKKEISIEQAPRIFSREAREKEKGDTQHKYGVVSEEIKAGKYWGKVNGNYIGINESAVNESLDKGINLVLPTGSVELLEKIQEGFSENPDDLCLVYISGISMSEIDYFILEKKRNPQNSWEENNKSAQKRYKQSKVIIDYYQKNEQKFKYAYLNASKAGKLGIVEQYSKNLFEDFFEALIENKKENGVV